MLDVSSVLLIDDEIGIGSVTSDNSGVCQTPEKHPKKKAPESAFFADDGLFASSKTVEITVAT